MRGDATPNGTSWAAAFLVWALANRSLRHPEQKAACLEVMDRIIDETLKTEQERGMYHFLMPYARDRPFVMQPPRSLFLDGEMALMLAARRLVAEKEAYREPLRRRVDEMVRRMEAGPVLCAESYPDECWMFCNSVALAAIRMSDRLDGTRPYGLLPPMGAERPRKNSSIPARGSWSPASRWTASRRTARKARRSG